MLLKMTLVLSLNRMLEMVGEIKHPNARAV